MNPQPSRQWPAAIIGAAAIVLSLQPLAHATQETLAIDADETRRVAERPSMEELLEAVSQLDAPDYRTREQAMQWLVEARWKDAEIEAILSMVELSVEQRNRLLAAWHDRVVYRPRGAMGIEQRWIPDEDSIYGSFEVIGFVPELPARNFLELRDRITHFDGQRPIRGDDLLRHVQELEPGDTVALIVDRVVRDEQGNALRDEKGDFIYTTIEIDLPLGSLEKLVDRNGVPQASMSAKATARREMRKRMTVYAAPPERIQFEPGVNLNEMPTRSRLEQMVDQHTSIVFLKRQLDFIDQGRATYDGMLEQWDRTLLRLRSQIDDPATTDAEREFLEMVVERFLELTQPGRGSDGR